MARGFFSALSIITSFTIAHSITLAAATFNLAQIPSRIVEPLIAASIVYVGVENLWRGDDSEIAAVGNIRLRFDTRFRVFLGVARNGHRFRYGRSRAAVTLFQRWRGARSDRGCRCGAADHLETSGESSFYGALGSSVFGCRCVARQFLVRRASVHELSAIRVIVLARISGLMIVWNHDLSKAERNDKGHCISRGCWTRFGCTLAANCMRILRKFRLCSNPRQRVLQFPADPSSGLMRGVKQGGTNEEILEWCFEKGRRLNQGDLVVWDAFASKLGWRDFATPS